MSPDGPTKLPPEEKLLKLIRGQGTQPAVSAAASHTPFRADASGRGEVVAGVAAGDVHSAEHGSRWVKPAVGCLGLVLAIELVLLMLQVTRPLPTVSVPLMETASSSATTPPSTAPPQEVPSLVASAARSLFAVPVDLNRPSSAPRAAQSASAKQLAARLTLMGIVSGNPAQAIIEDSETKKTYFVMVGQVVVEGAVLEQILDNRVVLNLDGEKIDLTL